MLFFAIHRDEVILSEFTLDHILDLLADLNDSDEDCVIWHGPHVA